MLLALVASGLPGGFKGSTNLPRKFSLAAFGTALLLVGISAFRWQIGTDYTQYESNYWNYAEAVPGELSVTGEPGIRVIAWLSSLLDAGPTGMFAISAAITVGLYVRTMWRWSPDFAFSLAMYFLIGSWHGSFNTVRQYLAAAILFAGYRAIVDRKLVQWLVVVFVAAMFHVTAIAGVLFYLIPNRKLTIRAQILLLTLGLVVVLQLDTIFELWATWSASPGILSNAYAQRHINLWRVAFAFVPLVMSWVLHGQRQITVCDGNFYINMFVIFAAVYLASVPSALIARFTIYPAAFVPTGLSYVTDIQDERGKSWIRVVTLIVYGLFWFIEVSGHSDLNPYRTIWQK